MKPTRILVGLAVVVTAVAVALIAAQDDVDRSFTPYLVILLVAAPLGALGAGLATGGVRFVASGEREVPAPERVPDGFGAVHAFRPYLALRDSAAAALAVFAVVGGVALVDYFGRARRPAGLAVLALLAWLGLLGRLLWAVVKRTWVGRRLEEGRLMIRPAWPEAGRPLHVVFEQPARTDVFVRAVDLTLIADRSTSTLRHGKVRYRSARVVGQRLRLSVDARVWPGAPLHVEGTFVVDPEGVPASGLLRWRIEARTRTSGPPYQTLFLIGMPDEEEEEEAAPSA